MRHTIQLILSVLFLILCASCGATFKVCPNLSDISVPVLLGPINRIGGIAGEPINGKLVDWVVNKTYKLKIDNDINRSKDEIARSLIITLKDTPNSILKVSSLNVSSIFHFSLGLFEEISVEIDADIWEVYDSK